MTSIDLLTNVEKKYDEIWWPLTQLESTLEASRHLPCFISKDEKSMESFDHVSPIIDLCLDTVKKALSKYDEASSNLTQLKCEEVKS